MTDTPQDDLDMDNAPVGIVTFRHLGRTDGFTIPRVVIRALGWKLGDQVVVRATQRGNLIAKRVRSDA
jgi:antitoxin component of MazEF toxin-antitoxin module|tara:strand:- start:500 stop:703 length:204 start_codon:yes stop_codon:yes gene_type:complete